MNLSREKPDYANLIDTRTPLEKKGAVASWRALKTMGYRARADIAVGGEIAKVTRRYKNKRSSEARGR